MIPKHKYNISTALPPLFAFVCVVALWSIAVWAFRLPVYLLPSPNAIVRAISQHTFSIATDLATTMAEAGMGFLIGNTLGFAGAILFAYSRVAERAFYPYAIALKTTPIVAIAPILILWFGPGMASKVIASSVICFFPILVNAARGLRDVDPAALDLFLSLSANERQIFFKLRLPSALPYVFSALRISTSLSIIGAIVGEFLGATHGIGYAIVVAYYHLEMDAVFAAVITSAIGGIAFFGLVVLAEKFVMPWADAE
jgi:NitT/TauT family transport system permease protein